MKTSLMLAVFAVASVPAHGQTAFSFEMNGRVVHVAVPRHCQDDQCLSISTGRTAAKAGPDGEHRIDTSKIVGILSDLMARRHDGDDGPFDQVPSAPAQPSVPTTTDEAKAEIEPAPVQNTKPSLPKVETPSPNMDVAMTPPVVAVEHAQPSPVGVWLTQNKEGKVRIVQCGDKFCGYAVDGRSDGAKVLIDMKVVADRQWHGSVHDPKGGGTYDATMALKSPDVLAIRGLCLRRHGLQWPDLEPRLTI